MASTLSAGGGPPFQSSIWTANSDQKSPSTVVAAVGRIEHLLDQRGVFSDVTHNELKDISDILKSLSPNQTRQIFSRLPEKSLKTWADEISSHGIFGTGGLSTDERGDLFRNLASNLDIPQLGRLYQVFENTDHRAELTDATSQAMGTDEVKTVLSERADQLPPGTGQHTLQSQAKRLRQLQDAEKMVHYATDVYQDFDQAAAPNTLLANTRRLNPDHLPPQLGITRNDLIDSASGYYAAIYQQGQGATANYIVAFRGTENTNSKDWLTNLGSGLGFKMTQFQKADLLVSKLAESIGTDRMELTGHSLGGGLANYTGMKNSVISHSFNPKGTTWRENVELHDESTETTKYLRNYQVEGEILTEVQQAAHPFIMEAPGPVIKLPAIKANGRAGNMVLESLVEGFQRVSPFHDASQHDISGPIDRHDMDYVSRGLEFKREQSKSVALRNLFESFE